MMTKTECSSCGGTLARGFIFDRGHYDHKSVQTWVEGEPEESFWSGVKVRGREAYRAEAYRCGSCGRLEFYTTGNVDLSSIFS